MDFGAAVVKIADITIKVNEYIDKIIEIRNKYIVKINKCIDDLETTINSAVDKINAGARNIDKWLQIKIEKITKKIQDLLDKLKSKIDALIDQLSAWYEKTILNIKVTVIIAVYAKLGIDCTRSGAELLADMIPHPSIESLLPNFEINLPLEMPDLSVMVEIEKVNLPRL